MVLVRPLSELFLRFFMLQFEKSEELGRLDHIWGSLDSFHVLLYLKDSMHCILSRIHNTMKRLNLLIDGAGQGGRDCLPHSYSIEVGFCCGQDLRSPQPFANTVWT